MTSGLAGGPSHVDHDKLAGVRLKRNPHRPRQSALAAEIPPSHGLAWRDLRLVVHGWLLSVRLPCFPHIYSDTAAVRWLAENPAWPARKTCNRWNSAADTASNLPRRRFAQGSKAATFRRERRGCFVPTCAGTARHPSTWHFAFMAFMAFMAFCIHGVHGILHLAFMAFMAFGIWHSWHSAFGIEHLALGLGMILAC